MGNNKSILTRNQKKIYSKKGLTIDGESGYKLDVTIRYDDNCGNGHNSFSITGWGYKIGKKKDTEFGGCCHEEISEHFPELKKYIEFHSSSSDGPIHYVANTMYYARDRTHEGKEIGEPVKWRKKFKFKDYPFTFEEQKKGFWEYLDSVGNFNNISIEAIKYDGGDSYNFSDNYSLTGFIKDNEKEKWYKAPFSDREKAEEFLLGLQNSEFEYIKTPIEWCEAVEPNLEAARSVAQWEDATLEQLRDKDLLESRLPMLKNRLKEAVEELGFIY